MRKPSRVVVAVALALLSAMAVFVPPASAARPVEIGQCVITINLPRPGPIEIPTCWSGPPL